MNESALMGVDKITTGRCGFRMYPGLLPTIPVELADEHSVPKQTCICRSKYRPIVSLVEKEILMWGVADILT